jgi:hypothetical protein
MPQYINIYINNEYVFMIHDILICSKNVDFFNGKFNIFSHK